jgi:hypothetical protein
MEKIGLIKENKAPADMIILSLLLFGTMLFGVAYYTVLAFFPENQHRAPLVLLLIPLGIGCIYAIATMLVYRFELWDDRFVVKGLIFTTEIKDSDVKNHCTITYVDGTYKKVFGKARVTSVFGGVKEKPETHSVTMYDRDFYEWQIDRLEKQNKKR